jgi:hypothetical protein
MGVGGQAGSRELCQRAVRGDDAVPAEERSNALRVTATKEELLARRGRFVTELAPRGAPLLLVLRDAATADPKLPSCSMNSTKADSTA